MPGNVKVSAETREIKRQIDRALTWNDAVAIRMSRHAYQTLTTLRVVIAEVRAHFYNTHRCLSQT